jgi:hypothetical protein
MTGPATRRGRERHRTSGAVKERALKRIIAIANTAHEGIVPLSRGDAMVLLVEDFRTTQLELRDSRAFSRIRASRATRASVSVPVELRPEIAR